MAKRKSSESDQPKKPTRRYTTVKFDAELVYKAKIITEYRSRQTGINITSADYLSDLLKAKIEADYRESIRAAHQEIEGEP